MDSTRVVSVCPNHSGKEKTDFAVWQNTLKKKWWDELPYTLATTGSVDASGESSHNRRSNAQDYPSRQGIPYP
ncbi:MAG: hypothetical protein ACI4QT_00965 [Kiritimatiellia bacterium]